MNWKNLKIGYKIGLGFFLLVLLTGIIGVLSFVNMSTIQKGTKRLSGEYIPTISESFQLEKSWQEVIQLTNMYDTSLDSFYIKKAKARISKFKQALDNLITLSNSSESLKSRNELFTGLQNSLTSYQSLLKENEQAVNDCSGAFKLYESNLEILNGLRNSRGAGSGVLSRLEYLSMELFQSVFNDKPGKLKALASMVSDLDAQYGSRSNNEFETAVSQCIAQAKIIVDRYPKAKLIQLKRMELAGNMMWDIKGSSDVGIDKVTAMGENTNQIIKNEKNVMIFSVIFVLILGGGLVYLLTNTITRPIKKGIGLANALADGDLTQTIDIERKDEVGDLAIALNKVTDNLRQIIANLADNSRIIEESSKILNSSAEAISDGTKQQAAAVEEVSSSMEEMYSNIQQSSDNARQTESIAQTSVVEINNSKDSFNMATQSLREIADKVSVINDIAFQTNLLALNAAVEAARAGEHGRGFAVVAQEVRKLADKSKIAAKEINDVSSATMVMSRAARRELETLIPEVERTANLVKEISASSLEQVTGVEQINNAVQQLNIVVQDNAQRSEAMSEQAQKLSIQSKKMRQLIKMFKL